MASPNRNPFFWKSVSPVRGDMQEEPVENTNMPCSSSVKSRCHINMDKTVVIARGKGVWIESGQRGDKWGWKET